MVHVMKPMPASPVQRVPSQSKTAMRGLAARTSRSNWSGVRRVDMAALDEEVVKRAGSCCFYFAGCRGKMHLARGR